LLSPLPHHLNFFSGALIGSDRTIRELKSAVLEWKNAHSRAQGQFEMVEKDLEKERKLREDGERELVKAMEQVRTITTERDALREKVKDLTDAGRPLCRLLVPL